MLVTSRLKQQVDRIVKATNKRTFNARVTEQVRRVRDRYIWTTSDDESWERIPFSNPDVNPYRTAPEVSTRFRSVDTTHHRFIKRSSTLVFPSLKLHNVQHQFDERRLTRRVQQRWQASWLIFNNRNTVVFECIGVEAQQKEAQRVIKVFLLSLHSDCM